MKKLFPIFLAIVLMGTVFLLPANFTSASTVDDLKQKIDERNALIKQLEVEINTYNAQLGVVSAKATTLKNAIAVLDTTIKKLGTQIKVTETKISSTSLTIQSLQDNISTKEKKITTDLSAIAKSLQETNEQESSSLIETLLSYGNLSKFWDQLEVLGRVQTSIKQATDSLQSEKIELSQTKTETEKKRVSLLGYQKDLADQKKIVELNKGDKAKVLTDTKSQESEYQKILAQKIAAKNAFEKELFDYENQLKIALDPKSFPSGHAGILSWPVDVVRITQLFGVTGESKRLYASGSHSGVDFGVPIGSKVHAVLSGTITAIGNTDLEPGCYSYGKWVLINHGNGLSTIYGHMSLQSVSPGDHVTTGQVIGYSGSTGYSTGPHVHLGVFATQGLVVQKYEASYHCKNVVVPIAVHEAYLDPMLYLPH